MHEIEYKVVFSSRKTLAISILPDATVIVRAPHRTSANTIEKLVRNKADWILRHTRNFEKRLSVKPVHRYCDGEIHLFRGQESVLRIEMSQKSFCRFNNGIIEIGSTSPYDPDSIKLLLRRGYTKEAGKVFPETLKEILISRELKEFKVSALKIRAMRTRWGSCSSRGVITLNTELIKLPHIFLEYVIIHEICHLKHHNHGPLFYELLFELFPEWKSVRKELRKFILNA